MITSGQTATLGQLLQRRAALEAELRVDKPLDVGPGATCVRRLARMEIVGGLAELAPRVGLRVAARAADGTPYTQKMLWVRSLDTRLGRTYELLVERRALAVEKILIQINREVFDNDAAFLAGVVEAYLHPAVEPLLPETPEPLPIPTEVGTGIDSAKGVLP